MPVKAGAGILTTKPKTIITTATRASKKLIRLIFLLRSMTFF